MMLRRIGWMSSALVSANCSVPSMSRVEHRVGAGVAQHGGEVVSGQLQVLRVSAVAVEHGGNSAFAARPSGRAFAGLGPYRCGKFVRSSSHDVAPV